MEQLIYWDNGGKDSYLHGSYITFKGKRVLFENRLLPSGNAIKTWHSQTNFQAHRVNPGLPLLQRGQVYYLTFKGKAVPEESIYLKVTFFNRFNEVLSFVILKDGDNRFTYPLDAYTYQVELMNAGNQRLLFEALLLASEEVENGVDGGLDEAFSFEADAPFNLVFLENPTQLVELKQQLAFVKLGNYLPVGDIEGHLDYYVAPDYIATLTEKVQKMASGRLIRLIGYGPIGNFAALYYHRLLDKSVVYITASQFALTTYEKIIGTSNPDLHQQVHRLFEEDKYHESVHLYGSRDSLGEEFQLVSPIMSRVELLEQLPFLEEMK